MHLVKTAKLPIGVITALALLTSGSGPVAANDLSNLPCTANDVEIVGAGVVVNEPCACTAGGRFDATVAFTVRNNTGTERYCIALHLVPDGVVLTSPVDVVLRDASGSSTAPGKGNGEDHHDTIMYGSIPNFPCNQGRVCFGQTGVTRGKCQPGACTTVAWSTSTGAAGCATADQTPAGGQCRHQQVCVVGFGATLRCKSGCTVVCGGTATLEACVSAPADRGPFTIKVDGSDGSTQTQSVQGDASGDKCVDVTVSPTSGPTTTYTLTVTDRLGCTRTDTTTVSVTTATATITPPSSEPCNGVLRYTASVTGFTGCSFTWTIDGGSLASFLAAAGTDDPRLARPSGTGNNTLDFRALDNACHLIEVSATCGNCTATASATAKQCASATKGCTRP